MLTHARKLFTLNGFDIKVDPTWLIIATLITWTLSQHYFPNSLPNAAPNTYLSMALVALLGLFASLLLHELAHSVVARRMGVPINSIILFLFGGVAELEAEPTSATAEFWIAIAGPAMSVCLAIGFWTVEGVAHLSGVSDATAEVLGYLALINLVIAIFNFIPAFPLDGGRVLRAILWYRTGDVLLATKTASRIGVFLGYTLMAMGAVLLFQGAPVSGLWQIMIGAFVASAAHGSYLAQLAKTVFDDKTVSNLMNKTPITAHPGMTLEDFVDRIVIGQQITFAPVTEDGILLGYIDRSVLTSIDREHWTTTRVGDVFVGLEPDAMVGADLAIQDLLSRISGTGRRKFLVVSGHHLLGVITLSDLAAHMRPHDHADHWHQNAE